MGMEMDGREKIAVVEKEKKLNPGPASSSGQGPTVVLAYYGCIVEHSFIVLSIWLLLEVVLKNKRIIAFNSHAQ